MSNKPLTRCFRWLVYAILFTSLRIDDIADYREFVFERHRLTHGTLQSTALATKNVQNSLPAPPPRIPATFSTVWA